MEFQSQYLRDEEGNILQHSIHINYFDGVDKEPHYLWVEHEDDLKDIRDFLNEYLDFIK